MSPLKRRMLFCLFGLALLSVAFWTGYEFLNLARMKQHRHAASAFCASLKVGMPTADVVMRANENKGKPRIAFDGDQMRVDFGPDCHCRASFAEEKLSGQKAACGS